MRLIFVLLAVAASGCGMTGSSSITSGCLDSRADLMSALAGEEVYASTCAYCHGADGAGLSGQTPPLAGNQALLATPESGISLLLITQTPAARLHGMEVDDLVANLGDLDDASIANAMTYVLNAWGNCGGTITTADVEAMRAAQP